MTFRFCSLGLCTPQAIAGASRGAHTSGGVAECAPRDDRGATGGRARDPPLVPPSGRRLWRAACKQCITSRPPLPHAGAVVVRCGAIGRRRPPPPRLRLGGELLPRSRDVSFIVSPPPAPTSRLRPLHPGPQVRPGRRRLTVAAAAATAAWRGTRRRLRGGEPADCRLKSREKSPPRSGVARRRRFSSASRRFPRVAAARSRPRPTAEAGRTQRCAAHRTTESALTASHRGVALAAATPRREPRAAARRSRHRRSRDRLLACAASAPLRVAAPPGRRRRAELDCEGGGPAARRVGDQCAGGGRAMPFSPSCASNVPSAAGACFAAAAAASSAARAAPDRRERGRYLLTPSSVELSSVAGAPEGTPDSVGAVVAGEDGQRGRRRQQLDSWRPRVRERLAATLEEERV